jgi:serine/threonine-protein kinase
MSDSGKGEGRVACPHCGASHSALRRRCPKTGRALGGDERLVGQLIDKRYRILRLLGDGPFGAVYKAEHVTVGRHVALRILPPALVERPLVLNRFLREARLMSSVVGRRLHQLVDAGLSSEGLAYVAYEYIRGRSLASTLSVEAPLELDAAVTIACELLEGLAAIHESGFVHRAVSPESILLQMAASGHEHAILSNFGAGALEIEPEATALGAAVAVAELPRVFVPDIYVPPERDKGALPHRREDIFGCGITLAACLSPPGTVRFGSELVSSGVPPVIEAIIARAAHSSPSARFESADDMRRHLLQYIGVEEDEPSSVTETHISDLRLLSRREKLHMRASLPEQRRSVAIDGEMAGAIARALRTLSGQRWDDVVTRAPWIAPLVDVRASDSVPLDQIASALEAGDAVLGAGDRLFCTVVGERAARDELAAALAEELGSMTPELFFDQGAASWARRLGHETARATNVGRGYGRLELRGHPAPSLAVCACFTAMITESLGIFRARHAEVNKTACEGVGDAACIYAATWM